MSTFHKHMSFAINGEVAIIAKSITYGLGSIAPAFDCEQPEHIEEVLSTLFVSNTQSPHILHATEKALNKVALGV